MIRLHWRQFVAVTICHPAATIFRRDTAKICRRLSPAWTRLYDVCCVFVVLLLRSNFIVLVIR